MWPRVAALVAVLIAILTLEFPSQSTASVPKTLDSPGTATASPDSVAAPQPEPSAVKIQLGRDSTLTAARVEPLSDFVRVIHADGTEEYLPNQRIRWIRDAEGRDRTSQVLDRGKSIGDVPISIRYRADRRGSPTLRGKPLPIKGSFPVIQVGVLARLDQDQRHGNNHPVSIAIDLGGIKNVSKRWGVGANFFYAGDKDVNRYGAKARFRRWLGPAIALDAAPGLLLMEDPGGNPFPGFVGELGLSLGDWISVTGQMEAVETKELYYTYAPCPYNEAWAHSRTRTDVSWYFGAKLGGEAAMGAFIGAFVLGAILVHGGSALY
jgi:hypothetical protein